jgi:hypothetical protein
MKTTNFATRTALIAGVIVSAVAGYISVTGLAALFPAGGVVVMVMAAAMEIGKVVAVACWRQTTGAMKVCLTALIAVLILITGLGVYGFLSSSNQADKAPAHAAAAQSERWAAELVIARDTQTRAETTLQRLDNAVEALQSQRMVTRAQTLRSQQNEERASLTAALEGAVRDQRRILEAQANNRVVTGHSELTPIRFAANALGMEDDQAVTLMILMLMLAFDPLGLMLVAAGSETNTSKSTKAPVVKPAKRVAKAAPRKTAVKPARLLSEVALADEIATVMPLRAYGNRK